MVHKLIGMARRVPCAFSEYARKVFKFSFENRTFRTVFWSFLLISSQVFGANRDPASLKTLKFLQMGFSTQTEMMQKKLLRDMALLDSEDAIPFFAEVALNAHYSEETRREALKGILAIDSKKYRMVLDPLQTTYLSDDQVIKSLMLIHEVDLLSSFMKSLTFDQDSRITQLKLSAILRLWKTGTVEGFDYSIWPKDKATKILADTVRNTTNPKHKERLTKLWGYVRTQ